MNLDEFKGCIIKILTELNKSNEEIKEIINKIDIEMENNKNLSIYYYSSDWLI